MKNDKNNTNINNYICSPLQKKEKRKTLGKPVPATKTEKKREAELILDLGETDKDLVKYGPIWKRGGGRFSKDYKQRFIILSRHSHYPRIYYYKQTGAGWRGKSARGYFDLTSASQITTDKEIENITNAFQIITSDPNERSWFFRAENEKERNSWVDTLNQILKGTYNSITRVIEPMKTALLLPYEKFEFDSEPVGQGASGQVTKAVWDGMVTVAVKRLKNEEYLEFNDRSEFLHEIETLSKLSHPNILRMYGFFWKPTSQEIGLVTEFVKGGDLSKYIYDSPLDNVLKISICLSISRGMHYLHDQSLVHCDLKPQNVLVEDISQADLKICDFGLSILNKPSGPLSADYLNEPNLIAGTPAYSAPELPSPSPSPKVDVFSFAIIMWEIVTQKKAWEGDKSWDITRKKDTGIRPTLTGHLLDELIKQSWAQKPEQRPNFKDLYTKLDEKKLEILLNNVPLTSNNNLTPLQRVDQLFVKNETCNWNDFLSLVCPLFNLKVEELEHLKWLITKNTLVEKSLWEKLLKWFTPIVILEEYIKPGQPKINIGPQPAVGFTLNEIVELAKQPWFFGFLGSDEAKNLLLQKNPGSYLVRFSGDVGKFTLSVSYETKVAHWRITRDTKATGYHVFAMNEKEFKSISEIINSYKEEPLISPDSSDPPVFLITHCDRINDSKPKLIKNEGGFYFFSEK